VVLALGKYPKNSIGSCHYLVCSFTSCEFNCYIIFREENLCITNSNTSGIFGGSCLITKQMVEVLNTV